MTNTTFSAALNIDSRLLNNRYAIELNAIKTSNKSAYDQRNAIIVLDHKYNTVKEALVGLYELNIQHTCNLSELLEQYTVVIGQSVK